MAGPILMIHQKNIFKHSRIFQNVLLELHIVYFVLKCFILYFVRSAVAFRLNPSFELDRLV